MYDTTALAGQSQRPLWRSLALVLVGAFAVLSGSLFVTQTSAYAFAITPPVFFPASLAPALGAAGGAGGVGVVAGYGGGAGAFGAGAAVAAVAPVAIAAGAVLLTGAAIWAAWEWADGRNTAADGVYDPVARPAFGSVLGNTAPDFPHTDGWGPDPYFGLGHMKVPLGTYYVGSGPSGAAGFGSTPQTLVVASDTGSGFTPWCTAAVRPCIRPAGSVGPGQAYKIATDLAGTNVVSSYGSPTTAPAGGTGGAPGTTVVTTRPTSRCSNGSSVVGAAVTFTGATPSADLPEIVAPACPAGTTRTGFTTPSTFPDGATAPSPIAPWTAPTVPSGYGECQGVKATSCVLTLFRVGADGQVLNNCTGSTTCAGWQTQLQPEVVTTTRTDVGTDVQTMPDGATRRVVRATAPNGDTYRCVWGPYTLPVNECTTVPTEPPTTGVEADPAQDACRSADLSLNPVTWVIVPLKCLFIPRDTVVQAAGARLGTAWNGTAPAVVATAVDEVFAPVVALKDTPVQGCSGPPFVIPKLPTMSAPLELHPLSTCNTLTTYLLGIYLPLATAFVYLGGFFAGTRLILKAINVDSPVES